MEIPPELKQKLQGMHETCVAETGVSADSLSAAMTGNFPDDPTLKEHVFCMSKKFGFQNGDGQLQVDTISGMISTYVPDPTISESLMKCVVQRDTPQNTAIELAKCAYQIKLAMA